MAEVHGDAGPLSLVCSMVSGLAEAHRDGKAGLGQETPASAASHPVFRLCAAGRRRRLRDARVCSLSVMDDFVCVVVQAAVPMCVCDGQLIDLEGEGW